jgi:hypothetical protein
MEISYNREISDEEILLLGLCRLNFSEEYSDRLLKIASRIKGWDYFLSLASLHGVASLVSRNLEAAYIEGEVPVRIVNELRSARMMSLGRNAFLFKSAETILRTFNDSSLKCILLKGMALELSVYGNEGLRQMTDIDILLGTDECLKASELLEEKGFRKAPVKSWFHRPLTLYTGKHLPSLEKDGVSVDIHHDLFGGRRSVLTKLLSDNSAPIKVGDQRAFIPESQIFFLYLVKHLWLHELNNESQLRLYTDLVVLLEARYGEIINYDLIDLASKAGITKILAHKLEALRDLCGIGFPDWVDDFIDRWYSPATVNKFVYFLRSPKNNPPERRGRAYRNSVAAIPGLHRKILFVLGDLIPTVGFMKKRYKCSSAITALLHYPLRLGKIILLIRG